MVDRNATRRMLRKKLNLDQDSAVLGIQTGPNAGQIHVPYKRGYYWVCTRQAIGFSAPKALPLGPNCILELKPGMGVKLGYNDEGERCILSADKRAIEQSGGNPATLNPLDPTRQYQAQQGIVTASCTPDNPDTTLFCVVNGWIFIRNRTVYRWGNPTDGKVDLSSYVPSSGEHRLACVFMLADGSTTEVKASTAKSQLAQLGVSDMQECITTASSGSTPIHFWRMYGGQTAVKASDTFIDGRQFINVGMGDVLRAPRIVTAAGAVTVTVADDVVLINKTVGAATTVNLPASPVTGSQYAIKDKKGDAASNNITITPFAGNIDGSSTYVISTNYGKATVLFDGTEWLTI